MVPVLPEIPGPSIFVTIIIFPADAIIIITTAPGVVVKAAKIINTHSSISAVIPAMDATDRLHPGRAGLQPENKITVRAEILL